MTWPNPTQPGVPTNPERDGWHWLQFPADNAPHPVIWDSTQKCWYRLPHFTPQRIANEGAQYLGPCLLPSEVKNLITTAVTEERNAIAQWLNWYAELDDEPNTPDLTTLAHGISTAQHQVSRSQERG